LKGTKNRKPTLSDIEFVMTARHNSQDSSVFSKGNLTVVPLVSREFSSDLNRNRLLYYLEIYQGSDSDESVFVEATVRRRWGSMVYRDSMTVSLEASVVRQLREISLDSLAPGDYTLELRLRGRRHKKLDERVTGFSIAWTQDAMLRSDYGSTLNLIGLIAEPNEISKLGKLKTYEERFDGITEFWLRRDPTPGTSTNEVRQEFFRRVRFVNRAYSFMRQQGWRTDRGRIYIKHGEPDEIDDYPFAPNSHPYQEWHYYRDGRYRRFTFVDENEDGDYRLVYPYDGLYMRPDF
ncbi:MAG: GWxTD domain-containing protein, partial [candidate division Zixibacteria bacterium]|nr:GWxTD domain-containing protein [candidate division Zixibacteria bacterium]